MIVGAAVRTKDGRLWVAHRPGRHGDAYDLIVSWLGFDPNSKDLTDAQRGHWRSLIEDREEGFVTENLAFLDRREALRHAQECEQTFLCGECRHVEHESGKCDGFSIQHDRCQCDGYERGPGLASEDLW